jgi:hypothetical protein
MRGRAAAVALPALVVLALVAVVAVASTGSVASGDGATRTPSESLYDALFTVLLVAVGLGAVLLVYGLAQRKAIAQEVASGKYRRTGIVSFLAFFGIFTVVTYWRLSEWDGPPPPDEEGGLAFPGRPEVQPTLPEGAEASYEPSLSWIPIAIVGLLLLSGAVAYALAERRSRRERGGRAVLARELAEALDESLDDLRAEADPRKAIIAAYARLERALAASGVARAAAETAEEYLARVLHDLDVDPAAVRRLTDLFTEAKFSPHAVDATMKEQAIGALEHVRDELRAVRESSRAATDHAPTPAGASS